MNENQLKVLRIMADGTGRASWQITEAMYGPREHVTNEICRPAVELKNVGLLSWVCGIYQITEFGRKALAWHTEGK